MAVNIYDSANQIERDIRETPQFIELKSAFDALKEDEAEYKLFIEFQELQVSFQQKQMTGEEFTDEDAQNAQALTEKVQSSEKIANLMQKEQAFSVIINDLNRIIMTPVKELYEDK
ncbi:YlbF family regulator [Vagococcus xieshaowenii]|uniref:UPF0342 protein E4031_06235 n=1 Tax=Vagococcus xieshaowenii TaxID=2562451 RepID=A0AAJ5EFH4_9ENTE|nr:YlbF family regulator [Vagococcus xieshaowenii]QCA29046.1 YlbF family regulator [Vagococcus xieshaowenii]TFZ40978.1 YlbF family regulator [Vagococcus xieshaowenii]